MSTRIYYNGRCSKCRQSLQLLEQKGEQPEVLEYLKQPPSAAELGEILDLLGLEPRELMRQHEAPYKEQGLDNPDLDRETLIAAMVEHPILIERPIVIRDGQAVIGRPPEKILDILS